MILQLHHQNKKDSNDTNWISQIEIKNPKSTTELIDHLKEMHEEDPPPEGYQWLFVPKNSKHFIGVLP